MKRFIAFAWAVEPLAFRVEAPPHCTSDALELVLVPGLLVAGELLSEPQAESRSALAARRLRAAPFRLSVTWESSAYVRVVRDCLPLIK
jgi:hypothetical protein